MRSKGGWIDSGARRALVDSAIVHPCILANKSVQSDKSLSGNTDFSLPLRGRGRGEGIFGLALNRGGNRKWT
jgi:hypothetical protein